MKRRSSGRSLLSSGEPGIGYRENQRRVFLSELAATSSVTVAADKAGLAKSTIYLWREKDPEFADAWRKALTAGFELLETELLERARHGVLKPVFHNGRKIGAIRQFNDHAAFRLLSLHKQTVALERAAREQMGDISEMRARIDAKLDAMRDRLEYQRQRKQDEERENKQPGSSLSVHYRN
ncbi:hypothetical protein SAMN02745824_0165 [Parasphingorhabdus marina DSM 22363]|uniref:Phage terminase small subunit n=1 Tax=Parasphingorhabdus marina DSM 22363 TaxID=1123272 RepID=A0A1N6CMC1_9SPHN|nr:hypothetical protein [Parasphingorhabdus marina]SIN59636.1 hypothetical protein SAMN02745824_0165 [Parasphingorhabdus marina DSM 22363]